MSSGPRLHELNYAIPSVSIAAKATKTGIFLTVIQVLRRGASGPAPLFRWPRTSGVDVQPVRRRFACQAGRI